MQCKPTPAWAFGDTSAIQEAVTFLYLLKPNGHVQILCEDARPVNPRIMEHDSSNVMDGYLEAPDGTGPV